MIPKPTHKRCTSCSEWLPFSAFPKHKRMHNGISSHCRKCHRAATQDWRDRNRDEINRARHEAYGSSNPHRYPKSRASARKSPDGEPSRGQSTHPFLKPSPDLALLPDCGRRTVRKEGRIQGEPSD